MQKRVAYEGSMGASIVVPRSHVAILGLAERSHLLESIAAYIYKRQDYRSPLQGRGASLDQVWQALSSKIKSGKESGKLESGGIREKESEKLRKYSPSTCALN